jgi:hypothetical protein
MILEQNVFVSGLRDERDDLLICLEESFDKGIKLLPVLFNDNHGKWTLKLWCAKAAE